MSKLLFSQTSFKKNFLVWLLGIAEYFKRFYVRYGNHMTEKSPPYLISMNLKCEYKYHNIFQNAGKDLQQRRLNLNFVRVIKNSSSDEIFACSSNFLVSF